jgi:ABC-type nitrate/sulfonate/bicarbonate transport system substrate-binding protein
VLVIEPFRSRIVEEGTGTKVADFLDDVLTNQIMAFWIASRPWAAQNGKAIASFKEGTQEGLAFLRSNAAEAREIEKKYLGVNARDLPSYEFNVSATDLKFFQDIGKEFGLLKGAGDPAALILK